MSEDREDSRRPFEEGESPLLKPILFGVFAGIFVTAIKFGGLFGISSSSIREGILGILAAGCVVQPDTSLVVAVGANALLGGLYYLAA